MRDHDAHTHPNTKKPGIGLTWRNLRGERPQTAQSIERNRRVAELRITLTRAPELSAQTVMLIYGLKSPNTAKSYLALAREPPIA